MMVMCVWVLEVMMVSLLTVMTVSVYECLSDLVGSNCVHCSYPSDLGNKCTPTMCVHYVYVFVCSL